MMQPLVYCGNPCRPWSPPGRHTLVDGKQENKGKKMLLGGVTHNKAICTWNGALHACHCIPLPKQMRHWLTIGSLMGGRRLMPTTVQLEAHG